MVVKKKKTAKKPAKAVVKKSAKKASVKAVKSAKPKAKASAKKAAKKPAAKKTVAVQPVTNAGVVTMRPVDGPGVATEGDEVLVKPELDKETGVITMVPKS
jgi:hypothetical protein